MKTSFAAPLCRWLPLLILGTFAAAGNRPARAAGDELPPNLGRGLRPLVEWHHAQSAPHTNAERQTALATHLGRNAARVQTDGAGQVTVDVRLDGTVPAADVKTHLAALGLTLTGEHAARRPDGRDGTLTVHLPLAQAEAAAKIPGVFSVLLAHRPHTRAGRVTSQGVDALKANAVQASGYTGKGITVGVISDSYDVATAASAGAAPSTKAFQDIANGDLPAAGVTVLQDGSSNPDDESTDEGRAMLQIIHDVAPDAALAFCAVGESQNSFAANVKALRTSSRVGADIIVDDIGFDDEPFFSDGIIADAIDEVVTSTSLSGHPVIYYSAAGNDGDLSYAADFTPLPDAFARNNSEGVNFTHVDQSLTAGGVHNFKGADVGHGKKFVQTVTVSGGDANVVFQWDDPFLPGKITTDYNLLVFDAAGNYRSDLSGIDANFNTGEAIEFVTLPLNKDGSDATYRLVISQGANSTGTAKHLRYIVGDSGIVTGKYLRTAQPTIFGHSAAANADGVAAFDVHDLTTAESFESFGPVTIYFDGNGNRLATPEVRAQPTIAAVDGVDTSFFPEGPVTGNDSVDSDHDGFPNFYGTSAAAPHAAGVAALLLQAAGGPESRTATQMRSLLESTADSHDLDPATSVASFTSADGLFSGQILAKGDNSNNSAYDQKFFTITYTGPAGSSLHKAIMDLSPAGENFDQSSDNGFKFTIGQAVGVTVTNLVAHLSTGNDRVTPNAHLLIKIPRDGFPSGGRLAFGIDRDNAKAGNGGNDADLLADATVAMKFIKADGTTDKAVATFKNQTGTGYSPDVGYGLINAQAALAKLLGH